jgi:Viral alkaline exonuclease
MAEAKVQDVAIKTTGQSKNQLWLLIRKNKVTASSFGSILKAMEAQTNRKTYSLPDSLFKQLQSNYNLEKVKVYEISIFLVLSLDYLCTNL